MATTTTLRQMSEQAGNHLQFDVPPTSAGDSFPDSKHKRPFSIDLSLELEHQLAMDSPPPTPSHNAATHQTRASADSLDPHVLAHIVRQLQQSMADMAKERDDLLQLVAQSTAKEAELTDALQHMTDKATGLEEAYTEARRKLTDDEEAISMLRSKVEESRRGLMRLQSEKRQSVGPMALDLSRAGSVFGSPASSKRASFTPLTGTFTARPNGHRRISSQSDFQVDDAQSLIIPAATPDQPSSKASRRASSFFARSPAVDVNPLQVELDSVRKELLVVKDELEEARHELQESNEAKDASETCVKALREFIAENNVGADSPAPPPGEAKKPFNGSGGWGFKLWKVDTSVKPAVDQPSATTPSATPVNQMSPATVPITRKFGGFFGSRASVSSIETSPQLQSNAAASPRPSQRESIYSFSDASSVTEPLSPTSEEADTSHVLVRTLSDGGDSPPLDTGKRTEVVA